MTATESTTKPINDFLPLETYIVTLSDGLGERIEVTGHGWTDACRVALNDDRICHVKRISAHSDIFACYRPDAGNTMALVGTVCHIKTIGKAP